MQWLEVNAHHAFTRCESSKGRYDATLTRLLQGFMREVFKRRLVQGLGSNREAVPVPVPKAIDMQCKL